MTATHYPATARQVLGNARFGPVFGLLRDWGRQPPATRLA